jgi:hypothetical protein
MYILRQNIFQNLLTEKTFILNNTLAFSNFTPKFFFPKPIKKYKQFWQLIHAHHHQYANEVLIHFLSANEHLGIMSSVWLLKTLFFSDTCQNEIQKRILSGKWWASMKNKIKHQKVRKTNCVWYVWTCNIFFAFALPLRDTLESIEWRRGYPVLYALGYRDGWVCFG